MKSRTPLIGGLFFLLLSLGVTTAEEPCAWHLHAGAGSPGQTFASQEDCRRAEAIVNLAVETEVHWRDGFDAKVMEHYACSPMTDAQECAIADCALRRPSCKALPGKPD